MKFFAKKNPAQKSAPAAATPSPFTIRESRLCGELRVSKDELRERRQYFLHQGTHWDYVDKRVYLSAVGAEILRGTVKASVPKDAAAADSGSKTARPVAGLLVEKNPPPVAFAGRLTVWAIPVKNPKLVVCHLPGTDPSNPLNLVSLLVRSNQNFLRGMLVPPEKGTGSGVQVKQISESRYELLGECPRYRGRW